MLVTKSLSLKIKLIFSIPLFILFIFNCRADTLWGQAIDELRARIRSSDFSFLRRLELKEKDLAEVFRLGPGAPYYFYFILEDLELPDSAREMLKLQWKRGGGMWKEEAGLLVLEELKNNSDYPELERTGKQMLAGLKDAGRRSRCERLIIEALYRQKKDDKTLRRLDALAEDEFDEELRLFQAVSSYRLGLPGWQDLFSSLFLNHRSGAAQVRALSFLELEERYKEFSEDEYSFFLAKALLYMGKAEEAAAILENTLAKTLPAIGSYRLPVSLILEELADAYFKTGNLHPGAEYLLGLAEKLPRAEHLYALELAGRLYRKEKEKTKALGLLNRVIRETEDPGQRDRAAWFYLDLLEERRVFLRELERLADRWVEPAYFSDILEREISEAAAGKNWDFLLQMYRILNGTGPDGILSRLAYLLGRLSTLGLLTAGEELLSPEALFAESKRKNPGGYYAFLSSAFLADDSFPGQLFSEASGAAPEEDAEVQVFSGNEGSAGSGGSSGSEDFSGYERYLWGFFDFGLPDLGYERILALRGQVNEKFIKKAAQELQRQGHFLESIRLMNIYLGRKRSRPDLREFQLLYPRGFSARIEDLAGKENIPRSLFYALIREESHFDPEIVSAAGAVGLTQLMPETARDVARRLKMEEPEMSLKDPHLNLELGSRHLSKLLGRLEDIPRALMAYNAGLSRVRGWEKRFPDLPVDLLVESIPYRETRGYVRKILVSSVYYGYLYEEKTPGETVFLFYPGLTSTR